MLNEKTPKEIAKELYDKGYRQISRKFGIISRVDISVAEMRQKFIDDNFGDETSSIPSCSLESQKEHYRRCCSEDTIENVPQNVMAFLRQM